ncbi:MAG: glycoside hydrolase family 5 protein, partial [Clostridia bacterium]|nr:glycoside hydrolase family 5 protein [Clostridia bacterium]
MLLKRCAALFLSFVIMLTCAIPCYASEVSGSDVSASDAAHSSGSDTPIADSSMVQSESFDGERSWIGEMADVTASQLADDIKVGWNLGESLDSWSSDAGYDDYHNSNAYQMVIRYDDANGIRSTSIANSFDENNKCSFKWHTGLITSEPNDPLGDIGFEIWNLALEDGTTVTVNCTKALLTRRNNVQVVFEELLGEHTLTITKYGTVACLTEWFPSNLSRTYGIMDGTCEVEVELVDFPQMNYGKPEYFETLWNNPLTTYDIITEVKAAGFNAIRVPVTYFNHTVSSTDTIDTGWLNRIQTVVDYIIAQDMYCIIDMHNDGSTTGWLRVNTSQSDVVQTKYVKLWRQIAEHFKDYNEKLLFQGFNELTNEANVWGYPGGEDITWVNNLNQQFVNTVRSTGGNNSQRCLVLMPYAGSYDSDILRGFSLPRDTATD